MAVATVKYPPLQRRWYLEWDDGTRKGPYGSADAANGCRILFGERGDEATLVEEARPASTTKYCKSCNEPCEGRWCSRSCYILDEGMSFDDDRGCDFE